MNEKEEAMREALYAEWLMDQPEARVCNGDRLIELMECQWGWKEFMEQFPRLAAKSGVEPC